MPKGENNGRAKLSVKKVKEIRETWDLFKGASVPLPGKPNNRIVSAKKLAKKYRVSTATMHGVLSKKTWKGI